MWTRPIYWKGNVWFLHLVTAIAKNGFVCNPSWSPSIYHQTHDTHTLLSKTILPAPQCAPAESLENTFLMDVWRRLVFGFILGKWSFCLICARLFLYHLLFPPVSSSRDARSWTLLRSKWFYCCFWNRLNKFSPLKSITSSQFALGFLMLVRFHWKNRGSKKKDKFRLNRKCLGFTQNSICQALFFL